MAVFNSFYKVSRNEGGGLDKLKPGLTDSTGINTSFP